MSQKGNEEVAMRHIKGELIKKIVVPIRADKSGVFDKILSEEDKNIVSKKSVPDCGMSIFVKIEREVF